MSPNPVPLLRCCTAAFVACIVLAAQAQQLPDPRLTPGAFADSSTSVVCAPGYSRAHRSLRPLGGPTQVMVVGLPAPLGEGRLSTRLVLRSSQMIHAHPREDGPHSGVEPIGGELSVCF